jgi:hypothetical protein
VVVKCDRHLDESLEKLALRLGGSAPDILEDLVSVEVLTGIEEFDAATKNVSVHGTSVAQTLFLRRRAGGHQLLDLS